MDEARKEVVVTKGFNQIMLEKKSKLCVVVDINSAKNSVRMVELVRLLPGVRGQEVRRYREHG